MKALFDEVGHLTDYALSCLVSEESEALNELNRLEVSEHMAFCDECLLRYMALLEKQELIEPPELLQKSIMKKIRAKTIKILANQYSRVAIAASFALVFWVSGVFNIPEYHAEEIVNVGNGFSEITVEVSSSLLDGINKILDMDLKGVILDEKK